MEWVLPDRDFATVAGGPYSERQVTRGEDTWGLGFPGYDTSIEYPETSAAARLAPSRTQSVAGIEAVGHSVELQ